MSKEERKIRFDVALEIVEKVFSDYCKDSSSTRKQRQEFNDLVIGMIHFLEV